LGKNSFIRSPNSAKQGVGASSIHLSVLGIDPDYPCYAVSYTFGAILLASQ
jgi:hypothetical protein